MFSITVTLYRLQPILIMRVLLISLAALLVVFSSSTHSQIVERPISLFDVVTRAFEEIVALTDIGVVELQTHFEDSRVAFVNLFSQVPVNGPVPALVETAQYFQTDHFLHAQNIDDKVQFIYRTIIAGIHYQVNQLSQGSTEDANELIAACIETIIYQGDVIRAESAQRLIQIVGTAGANVLRLHQLALQDCGAHLAELKNELQKTLVVTVQNLQNEWANRANAIRHIILFNSNNLLVRIQNLNTNIITLPAIQPPSC